MSIGSGLIVRSRAGFFGGERLGSGQGGVRGRGGREGGHNFALFFCPAHPFSFFESFHIFRGLVFVVWAFLISQNGWVIMMQIKSH